MKKLVEKNNQRGLTLVALIVTITMIMAVSAIGITAGIKNKNAANEVKSQTGQLESKINLIDNQIEILYDDLKISDPSVTFEMQKTTNKIIFTNVKTVNYDKEIDSYEYYIKKTGEKDYTKIETTDMSQMVANSLIHNTDYDIKILAKLNGQTMLTRVKTVKTRELIASILQMQKVDKSNYENNTWSNQDVEIVLSGENTGLSTYSSQTGSAQGIYEAKGSTIINKEGVTKVVVSTTDGTNTVKNEYTIKVDKSEPTAGTISMQIKNNKGEKYSNDTWINESVYIALSNGSDNLSGHRSTSYDVTGPIELKNQTSPLTLENGGIYSVTVTTIDNVGYTSQNQYTIKIDKQAPTPGTLIMKLDNASGENYINDNWTNHSVYIQPVNGTDELGGHKSTIYNITGAQTLSNQTSPITLTKTGIYNITVITTDSANNTSSRAYIVKIDKESPTNLQISAKINNASGSNYQSGTWTNQNVYVKLTATDNIEITKYEWYENGGWTTRALNTNNKIGEITYTAQRDETIRFRVIDEVGNISEESSINVKIDKTAPVIGNISNTSGEKWTNKDITLSWNIEETASGIQKVEYGYDGTTWSGLLDTNEWYGLTRGDERNNVLYIRATDIAGNVSNIKSSALKIDKSVPTQPTAIAITPAINSLTVKASGSADSLSGLAGYQYSIDGGSTWTSTIANGTAHTFTGIKADTTKTIYARAVDNANNISLNTTQNGTTTTVSTNVVLTPSTTSWTNQNVTVTLSFTSVPTNYVIQYKLGSTGSWTTGTSI